MAAFLNALREEGTKDDCLRMLEKMWTDELAMRAELSAMTARALAAEAKLAGIDALIDASKRLVKGASWMHDVLVGKGLAGAYDAAAMGRADDATLSAIRKVERALTAFLAARGK